MLKLDNVTISYKNVPTVQNFNLDMKEGQIVSIDVLGIYLRDFGIQLGYAMDLAISSAVWESTNSIPFFNASTNF